MANNDLCEEISELLLSQSNGEDLPDYAKEHIQCCEKCKEQQEKILKMKSLIKSSKPDCPEFRNAVLGRIKDENIKIAQPKKKHHFPIGVMAAAAAVFAVYLSVYGTKLPEMVLNMNDTAQDAVCDEEAEIALESETDKQFNYADKAMFKKAETPLTAQFSAAAGENMKILNDVCDAADCDDISDGGAVTEAEAETALETESVLETEDLAREKTDAETLFEKYSLLYPDEISLEDIENSGWEVYRDFVMSVEDGNAEYSLEEFLNFAQ